MRKGIILAVIVSFICSCVTVPKLYNDYERGEIIEIHCSVGESVDPIERNDFDLFPGIEDFQSAQFYKTDNIGLEITFVTGEGTFISVIMDSLMVRILNDYIENYETYEDSIVLFEKKWKILDYDMIGIPITSHEIHRFDIAESHSVPCGLGMCCLGGLPSLAVAFLISGSSILVFNDSDSDIKPAFYPIFIAVQSGFVISGIIAGRAIDRLGVLRAIKEGRTPRPVDSK